MIDCWDCLSMVKQCFVYGCSKGAVRSKQSRHIFPNDKSAIDSIIDYKKITSITRRLLQTFIIHIGHTELLNSILF